MFRIAAFLMFIFTTIEKSTNEKDIQKNIFECKCMRKIDSGENKSIQDSLENVFGKIDHEDIGIHVFGTDEFLTGEFEIPDLNLNNSKKPLFVDKSGSLWEPVDCDSIKQNEEGINSKSTKMASDKSSFDISNKDQKHKDRSKKNNSNHNHKISNFDKNKDKNNKEKGKSQDFVNKGAKLIRGNELFNDTALMRPVKADKLFNFDIFKDSTFEKESTFLPTFSLDFNNSNKNKNNVLVQSKNSSKDIKSKEKAHKKNRSFDKKKNPASFSSNELNPFQSNSAKYANNSTIDSKNKIPKPMNIDMSLKGVDDYFKNALGVVEDRIKVDKTNLDKKLEKSETIVKAIINETEKPINVTFQTDDNINKQSKIQSKNEKMDQPKLVKNSSKNNKTKNKKMNNLKNIKMTENYDPFSIDNIFPSGIKMESKIKNYLSKNMDQLSDIENQFNDMNLDFDKNKNHKNNKEKLKNPNKNQNLSSKNTQPKNNRIKFPKFLEDLFIKYPDNLESNLLNFSAKSLKNNLNNQFNSSNIQINYEIDDDFIFNDENETFNLKTNKTLKTSQKSTNLKMYKSALSKIKQKYVNLYFNSTARILSLENKIDSLYLGQTSSFSFNQSQTDLLSSFEEIIKNNNFDTKTKLEEFKLKMTIFLSEVQNSVKNKNNSKASIFADFSKSSAEDFKTKLDFKNQNIELLNRKNYQEKSKNNYFESCLIDLGLDDACRDFKHFSADDNKKNTTKNKKIRKVKSKNDIEVKSRKLFDKTTQTLKDKVESKDNNNLVYEKLNQFERDLVFNCISENIQTSDLIQTCLKDNVYVEDKYLKKEDLSKIDDSSFDKASLSVSAYS